jgi:hypothetical protein
MQSARRAGGCGSVLSVLCAKPSSCVALPAGRQVPPGPPCLPADIISWRRCAPKDTNAHAEVCHASLRMLVWSAPRPTSLQVHVLYMLVLPSMDPLCLCEHVRNTSAGDLPTCRHVRLVQATTDDDSYLELEASYQRSTAIQT